MRASLRERDRLKARVGETVRVVLEGGSGRSLMGKIETIGSTVHSKSRVEPIPVIDVQVAIDKTSIALKNGQPVRVEIGAGESLAEASR